MYGLGREHVASKERRSSYLGKRAVIMEAAGIEGRLIVFPCQARRLEPDLHKPGTRQHSSAFSQN